mmetsp:Transcript_14478/g.29595  ORF Transcript_14478/g.29595 Transcript_14478/m.29595 type:complete len:239 (+) Transcript_14478:1803-2519(+)
MTWVGSPARSKSLDLDRERGRFTDGGPLDGFNLTENLAKRTRSSSTRLRIGRSMFRTGRWRRRSLSQSSRRHIRALPARVVIALPFGAARRKGSSPSKPASLLIQQKSVDFRISTPSPLMEDGLNAQRMISRSMSDHGLSAIRCGRSLVRVHQRGRVRSRSPSPRPRKWNRMDGRSTGSSTGRRVRLPSVHLHLLNSRVKIRFVQPRIRQDKSQLESTQDYTLTRALSSPEASILLNF